MSLFSFIKDAGEKLLQAGESAATSHASDLESALQKRLASLNLGIDQPQVKVDGDKVTISGNAASQEALEKAVLAVGNVHGVAQVDAQLQTVRASDNLQKAPETTSSTTAGTSTDGTTQTMSRFYTVKAGDNLSKISHEMYGNPNHYDQIFQANKPMLTSPDKIYPGQSLRIPALQDSASEAA